MEKRQAGFPRLYAAASLKQQAILEGIGAKSSFPRLYAAASLKRFQTGAFPRFASTVFRGFMPRPH